MPPREGPFRLRLERVEAFDLGVSISSADLAVETAERLQCELLRHEGRRCTVTVTDVSGRTVHAAKGIEPPERADVAPPRDHAKGRRGA